MLFEQGKPLEQVVLQALGLLGFAATGFKDDGSEFDAVFSSEEGRFIGEVEGKDKKAINIDKFSQLERNLNEDYGREGVTQYAKGVLFGNAYRLSPPADAIFHSWNDMPGLAAARLGVALIDTARPLCARSRHLKEHKDDAYAKACREAIFAANGAVVQFPSPATGSGESRGVENGECVGDETARRIITLPLSGRPPTSRYYGGCIQKLN